SLAKLVAAARDGSAPLAIPGVAPDPRGLAAFVSRAARALHVAHEAGIVHRDIKPGNIMVTHDGQPVLLDFGIAREESPGAVTLTATGDLSGTPAYLAAEQLETRGGVDRRADVYALGAVLYESLTLRQPFEAPTRAELFQKILRGGEPPDPRALNPA